MTAGQVAILLGALAVIALELVWRFKEVPTWWQQARKPVWVVLTAGTALVAFWLAGKRRKEDDEELEVPRHTFDDAKVVELRKDTEDTNLETANARREADDAAESLAAIKNRSDHRDDLLESIRDSTD